YIKISSEGIELGTQDNIYLKCNVLQKMGPATKSITSPTLPNITTKNSEKICLPCLIQAAERAQMLVILGDE
ncbi:DUF2345 domain-containing protein, partial [Gilliamella sp. Pas-s27]|uniref:DUF2345 domain-containing protein n=1 Tax=Gilliamella sp. Pas-s27 TaxID=2687311 RepID=UPI001F20ECF8